MLMLSVGEEASSSYVLNYTLLITIVHTLNIIFSLFLKHIF